MKYHFEVNGKSACGRGKNATAIARAVTCLVCKSRPDFIAAKAESDAARQAAFEAQVPREFAEPWHPRPVTIVCRECDGRLFRQGDRTCHGHYANYHCAACGHVESRLTETGMSF